MCACVCARARVCVCVIDVCSPLRPGVAMPASHIAATSPKKGHHQRSLSAAIPVSVSYTNLTSVTRRSCSQVCVDGRVGVHV